jgi:hypothetical protein
METSIEPAPQRSSQPLKTLWKGGQHLMGGPLMAQPTFAGEAEDVRYDPKRTLCSSLRTRLKKFLETIDLKQH